MTTKHAPWVSSLPNFLVRTGAWGQEEGDWWAGPLDAHLQCPGTFWASSFSSHEIGTTPMVGSPTSFLPLPPADPLPYSTPSAAFVLQQNGEGCSSVLKRGGRRDWGIWNFGNFPLLPLRASLPVFVTLLWPHTRNHSLQRCLHIGCVCRDKHQPISPQLLSSSIKEHIIFRALLYNTLCIHHFSYQVRTFCCSSPSLFHLELFQMKSPLFFIWCHKHFFVFSENTSTKTIWHSHDSIRTMTRTFYILLIHSCLSLPGWFLTEELLIYNINSYQSLSTWPCALYY